MATSSPISPELEAQIEEQTKLFNDLRLRGSDAKALDEAKIKLAQLKMAFGKAKAAAAAAAGGKPGEGGENKKKERMLLKTAKVRTSFPFTIVFCWCSSSNHISCREPRTTDQ